MFLYNRLFRKYGHFGFMVNFCLVPPSNIYLEPSTERQINVSTWLREISSCSCLTVLPASAWVLLSKTCKPLFAPLYIWFQGTAGSLVKQVGAKKEMLGMQGITGITDPVNAGQGGYYSVLSWPIPIPENNGIITPMGRGVMKTPGLELGAESGFWKTRFTRFLGPVNRKSRF